MRVIFDKPSCGTDESAPHLFAPRGNVLYRRNCLFSCSLWLLVIPRHLRKLILQELHDASYSGHMGVLRIYVRLEERFYWAALYKDVYNYVSSCDLCQRRETSTSRPAGLL